MQSQLSLLEFILFLIKNVACNWVVINDAAYRSQLKISLNQWIRLPFQTLIRHLWFGKTQDSLFYCLVLTDWIYRGVVISSHSSTHLQGMIVCHCFDWTVNVVLCLLHRSTSLLHSGENFLFLQVNLIYHVQESRQTQPQLALSLYCTLRYAGLFFLPLRISRLTLNILRFCDMVPVLLKEILDGLLMLFQLKFGVLEMLSRYHLPCKLTWTVSIVSAQFLFKSSDSSVTFIYFCCINILDETRGSQV